MIKARTYRWSIVVGYLCAVAVVSSLVWSYGYRQALDALALRSAADLELASDRVSSQFQVYQELAVLMADHPLIRGFDTEAATAGVQRLLQSVGDKTGALDLMYADEHGQVRAFARGVTHDDVEEEPYFRRALQGALGNGHAVLRRDGRRAYFFAAPVFAESKVRGALVVVVDVEDIEQTWRGSLPAVFFTNSDNQVYISNRRELLFWQRAGGAPKLRNLNGQAVDVDKRHFGPHEIWQTRLGPYLPTMALHQEVRLPVLNLTGEILVDVAPARRLAALQAAALAAMCLAFGAMLFLATERRRALAVANLDLERRVAERTQALIQAQADLVQAGKLSALGQMSAGISHELNQPLMAIQQFAENGAAYLERGNAERAEQNLGRISDLAVRMARIIKNLRAFARNENEPMGRVDLVKTLETAIELTENRLASLNVKLEWHPPTLSKAIYVRAGDVRLGQVFVNLINNAADAMVDQEERQITLSVTTGHRPLVQVRDIGPGLREPEKVFDPFYSTKSVGSDEGLGLGLSISYGLVQSFGGNIRGQNAERGAVFTVELEYWPEEQR
ncbi:sensor histidine kinase [Epibacterium ulvae]|uniref:sensor histidine kinase n=1 Tax=Epibacterium ulvae TaxID=1156985 RepID=UPI00249285EF|nr:ATP-binding protein [Epibacterium ulvae]